MLEFRIIKKSNKSRARLGILKTTHGEIETPAFVPVATQAVIKALSSEEVRETKSQILIANTFHLHTKGADKIIKLSGGIHKFMNWQKPLMTDSGGFQVFSLGFGKDYGVGKISKNVKMSPQSFAASETFRTKTAAASFTKVIFGQQPKFVKITNDGVHFNSPIDGSKLFLNPKKSIQIQKAIGADIIFAFDECPPPNADYEYNKKAMERTHRWAVQCLKAFKNKKSIRQLADKNQKQALFGIVQGGRYKNLRIESAKFIGSQSFDGFGIGGEFGDDKKTMMKMIGWVNDELPEQKPRHLLGIGYPKDIPKIIKAGADTFDCIAPTHYARRGIAFTSVGRLDIGKSAFINDKNPLDKKCACRVCQNYKRNYFCHLFRAKEITAMSLLTFHNLYFFNSLVEKIRNEIKKGNF